ncbi:MAG: SapC family protein [Pseudoprimorskyibacter sp.]|jgi:hypothetical protein|nr:SapC family protein [Pseudoprimorskyibacter sp.]
MTRSVQFATDIAVRYSPVTQGVHGMASWSQHQNQDWARSYHTAPIVMDELYFAAASMPIVFEHVDNGARPVALIDCGEASMILENGQWAGAYVPSVLRAHPFATTPTGEVRVDSDSEHWHLGPKGKRLYDTLGNPTEEFKQVQHFCSTLGRALARAQTLGTVLRQSDVFQPATTLSDLNSAAAAELFVVSPEKLRGLDAAVATRLLKSDALALAYAHLASLPKINQLKSVQRVRHARSAAGDTPKTSGSGEVDSFLAALSAARD